MYGCAFCSGVEHKVPLYFTRYFNKTLPYTAQDVRLLYASNRTGSASNSTNAVLVAPSYGSTSILAQKPLIQLLHRLEQTGRWRFIWKMHPSFLQLDGHNIEDESDVDQRERENVKFVLANFTVAQAEHASLLPFLEAFDVIITDLHSCVPFIATYFTPKVILSYFNDADYGAPERHKEFMSQLTTFVEPEELEGLLNTLPPAKGDPSFFHSQYGHVDGKEDLRFGNLAGWPTEQFEPSQPLQYRQVMARIALEWKRIYKDTAEKYSNDIKGANNALGFHAKFPLLKDDEDESVPITLPRLLPRDRQAAGIELRIMTFNIWNGGLSGGQPLEQTAKAILASGADVVGLQECSTVVEPSGCRRYMLPELMQYLPGWYYSDQKLRSFSTGRRNPWGVVSKFPIVSATEKGFGVKIQLNNHRHPEIESPYFELPEDQYPPVERSRRSSMSSASISSFTSSGRRESSGSIHMTSNTRFMYLFNCHLYYFPYQPFQLLKIPYEGEPDLETAEEAIQSCIDTRGKEMDIILDEIKQVAEQEKDVPIFLTGDFNEPSHLDWTALSVLAGLHPMTVKWPITERAYKAGLVDLWRAYRPYQMGSGCTLPPSPVTLGSSVQFPNSGVKDAREKDQIDSQVIERPGFTWTVLKSEADVRDHCDRIDYIFGLNRESSPIALKEMAIRMGEEPCRSGEKNEKMLRPWPSDHRAVVATVLL
ncbi:Endonuclease/exonuclease/phosphatase [Gamsiella multidivaricata]|uniref:Endonuclease/exonuclease/phosphatase n=1 Tax=Gamsiella multidivaricata TaxID=101098 RepID=UPI00221E4D31|nr:Endonuclease/exonuclease/phosphatase [Gamsiella multidivaricata]KAI7831259.1 Endonuclease/exonuclease/phosphatase [Gamsiella multidivaricata]